MKLLLWPRAFFHVETPDGHHHVGRFTIVTFRPPGAR